MKIKLIEKSFEEVSAISKPDHIKPVPQKRFYRNLMSFLSQAELKAINFQYSENGMDKLPDNQPALYLMNHSSFTDLQITAFLLKNRHYHIVTTNDGFVGKYGLMSKLGCIPTKKFISDPTLVKDMKYCIDNLNSSILMFPEASYTFDGTTTPLPESIGKCIKLLKVPVVMIKTTGAFLRDPLYNNLQKRNSQVSARITYLLSPEDIRDKSIEEINKIIFDAFEYNHFDDQIETNTQITEPFRADGLERVLYKCSSCESEGYILGQGTTITCSHCNTTHELGTDGILRISGTKASEPNTSRFDTIPEWYTWERECVRNEIESDNYEYELDVDICMLVDYKAIYKVGTGRLNHDKDGWHLNGCDNRIDFHLPVNCSYNLYADYYWYEIGDMISIGDWKTQYYCFPRRKEDLLVAKARLATEEMYKLSKTPN